jgi:uncharacterized membrane protein YidH (DUF202 family)
MTDGRPPRWDELVDPGVQQERTALAWERTAIATMVAGIILARVASDSGLWLVATLGLVHVAIGGFTLIWASRRYDDLHAPIVNDTEVVHPTAARVVGLTTISLTVVAISLAVLIALQ